MPTIFLRPRLLNLNIVNAMVHTACLVNVAFQGYSYGHAVSSSTGKMATRLTASN
eukprot:CAMPEP_0201610142 /NCGR_PEP_ID=MMETSP0492-20130828/15913_1 /ASSEMBLY_ACC=CAM_ASM_000837 /TAXON_ID=420259 /ORGANISM="Thalassiosira gravida, Strain GMp14c1" /LENGTH=54 /DNA_ID=CAMNT_0048075845 /DNA_START=62 /DNA_END=223 /DNA_ORIENTATION=-